MLRFGRIWCHFVSRITEIRSPKYVSSWDPKVLWWHAHTGCHPVNTTRDNCSKLEKHQVLVCWHGMLPLQPILIPIWWGGCKKNGHFYDSNSLFYLSETSFLDSIWIVMMPWAQIWARGVMVSQRHLLYRKGQFNTLYPWQESDNLIIQVIQAFN